MLWVSSWYSLHRHKYDKISTATQSLIRAEELRRQILVKILRLHFKQWLETKCPQAQRKAQKNNGLDRLLVDKLVIETLTRLKVLFSCRLELTDSLHRVLMHAEA